MSAGGGPWRLGMGQRRAGLQGVGRDGLGVEDRNLQQHASRVRVGREGW